MNPLFTGAIIGLVGAGLAIASVGAVTGTASMALTGALFVISNVFTAVLVGRRGASSAKPAGKGSRKPARSKGKRVNGSVKWFDTKKGFGFIVADNGDELFAHFRAIRQDGGQRRGLRQDQAVEFTIVQGDKGPQADDIVGL